MRDFMKKAGMGVFGLAWALLGAGALFAQDAGESAAAPVTVTASPLSAGAPSATLTGGSPLQVGGVVPGGLTLDQALSEAVSQSPAYRQAQDNEREASWEQVEAFSDGFLPHVAVTGRHMFDIHYPYLNIQFAGPPTLQFPSIQPDSSLSLDASFDLFDGFKNVHQLDSANNNHEAARILSDWSLFQLKEEIRVKFYEAIAAQELSNMADQNVKTLTDHLRIVNDQLQNGQATKYDLLRVKVELDEAQSDKISADDQVVLTRESLAQVMGMKADDRPLSGVLPVLDADDLSRKAAAFDFYQRPDLKAQELQAKAAADQNAAGQASLWIPKVSVIGEYQWYDTPDYLGGMVTHTDSFRDDYYIGASASWDLFDGASALAKANETGEKAKAAQDAYEATRLAAPYDFDLWKRKLVSNAALYKAKLTDVDEAKESARLATVGFQAGTRTTTDVLDAELEEYRAAEGLVQAQVNAYEALINLELSVGKRIENE
jgi:outer membrane protein TolC